MVDPITRDLRAYTYASVTMLVAFVILLVAGGTILKHERKTIRHQGCYVWSDGHQQCQRL